MFLKLLFIILGCFLLAAYVLVPTYMDDFVMVILLLVVATVLLSFALRKESNSLLRGQYLRHSTLFLAGMVIVHFQGYVDYLLGNISITNNFIWVNQAVVMKSMVLSGLAIVSFAYGYVTNNRKELACTNIQSAVFSSTKLLVIASAIFLVVYFATVNPLYFLGFYGSVSIGTGASYVVLLLDASLFGVIIQHCRNLSALNNPPLGLWSYLRSYNPLYLTVLMSYLASVMISGDRGPLMIYGIALFAGFVMITRKKISVIYFFVLLFTGAQIISLLGEIRNVNKGDDFISRLSHAMDSPRGIVATDEVSFSRATQELALSVRALHTAVDYVPERHGHMLGRFQFQQIVAAVPFVSNFYPLIFDDNSFRYKSSPSFITWIRQGDTPWSGDGTTCVADLYLDFGILGVILGMIIFGYLIRGAELSMYGYGMPSLITHVFLLIFLSKAIYISRSSILVDFKGACWTFSVLWLNYQIAARVRR